MKLYSKKAFGLATGLLLTSQLFSQTLITKWGSSIGMPCGNYTCYDIQTDQSGNHVLTGNITASSGIFADLDPSPSNTFPNSSTIYHNDFYVSKYDAAGNFISAFIIGSAGIGIDVARSIAIDKGNNIILTGYFNNTVDFDPSATFTVNANSQGGNDIFLAKYTSNGTLLWVKTFGGTGNDIGTKVITDNQNNIFLTANFSATIDIDPSATTNNLVSSGGTDVCLAKFDPNGNLIAGVSFGNTGTETAIDIVLDPLKKCYMTGNFSGTVDFDPHPTNSFSLSNPVGATDIYICQFDSLLTFQWAKSLVCSSSSDSKDINIDNSGNILLCGTYAFTNIDLDPSPTTTVNFAPPSSGRAGFIAKYTNTGNYLWAGVFGNSHSYDNEAINIWSDNTGNVFSTGHFLSTVDFDLSSSSSYTLTNNSGSLPSLYYAKYDNAGNFISANKMTNPGVKSFSSHADNNGDLLYCGNLYGAVNIDPSGSNPYTLAFPNQCGNFNNAFFCKYTSCVLPVVNTLTSSANGLCAGTSLTLSLTGTLNSSTDWRWSQTSCSSSNTLGLGNTVVVTPTANTVYYVKGIDGCAGSNLGCTSISITVMPAPNMTLTSSSASICPGKTTTLTVSGSSSYTWNTGATSSSISINPSVTTVYSASSTGTNGCVGTKTISISVFTVQPLTYSIAPAGSSDTICLGSNLSFAFTGGSQYAWSCTCSGFVSSTGSILYLYYTNLQSSEVFTVTSKSIDGCDNGTTLNITVIPCTGLNEQNISSPQIIVYPNPLIDNLFIENKNHSIQLINIIDVSGKTILHYDADSNENLIELNTSHLNSGIYLLEIRDSKGVLHVNKLIKE